MYDARSSELAVEDPLGKFVSYSYYPGIVAAFGMELSSSGSVTNYMQFGGEYDYWRVLQQELFAGARVLDAAGGQWASRDPEEFDGGDWNLYRYVGNNPANWVDPSGEGALTDCLKACAIKALNLALPTGGVGGCLLSAGLTLKKSIEEGIAQAGGRGRFQNDLVADKH